VKERKGEKNEEKEKKTKQWDVRKMGKYFLQNFYEISFERQNEDPYFFVPEIS
jgi:hypothetical protein